MHPEFPKNSGILLDATIKEPRAGDAVLCQDKDGTVAVRIYTPRTPRQWAGTPINSSYAPLDSVTDGLTILAVKVGAWGRRG